MHVIKSPAKCVTDGLLLTQISHVVTFNHTYLLCLHVQIVYCLNLKKKKRVSEYANKLIRLLPIIIIINITKLHSSITKTFT